jgi:hypothetical protein
MIKLRGPSPQANYTDRATAAVFGKEGVGVEQGVLVYVLYYYYFTMRL